MQRVQVTSSNIDSIGYDEETSRLEVKFKNNTIYLYSGVPKHEFTALIAAPSHGKHFNAFIKNKYAFTKL